MVAKLAVLAVSVGAQDQFLERHLDNNQNGYWEVLHPTTWCSNALRLLDPAEPVTVAECQAEALTLTNQCSNTIYGNGDNYCACVPKGELCSQRASSAGNTVYRFRIQGSIDYSTVDQLKTQSYLQHTDDTLFVRRASQFQVTVVADDTLIKLWSRSHNLDGTVNGWESYPESMHEVTQTRLSSPSEVRYNIALEADAAIGKYTLEVCDRCQDTEGWTDSEFGNGADTCAYMAEDQTRCTKFGEYSLAAMKGCPYSCGVCNRDSPGLDCKYKDIVILANPYSPADRVYMASEDERGEYVENTEGVIWFGGAQNHAGKKFTYDQFRSNTVEVATRALRRLPVEERGNMVEVSRHISASLHEDVCWGKWGSDPNKEGTFTQGTPPQHRRRRANSMSTWKGYTCDAANGRPCHAPGHWEDMNELFELHTSLGYKSVQYCQCWVYSAVQNTVARSLGIPTRVVSTFESAIDSDNNRAVDKFYTKKADGSVSPSYPGISSDSVWNFHAWNEMHYTRTDINCFGISLAAGCANGWQALDGTAGAFGPSSVRLLRANKNPTCADAPDKKTRCYNHEYVISGTNANLNKWFKDDSTSTGWRLVSSLEADPDQDGTDTVGYMSVTKRIGALSANCSAGLSCAADKLEVTQLYKEAEPSGPGDPTHETCAQEDPPWPCSGPRFTVNPPSRRMELQNSPAEDELVLFAAGGMQMDPGPSHYIVNLEGHADSTLTVGLEFSIADTSQNGATVNCSFTVEAVDYRGYRVDAEDYEVGRKVVQIEIQPGETKQCSAHFERESYVRFVASDVVDERAFGLKIIAGGSAGSQIVLHDHTQTLCTLVNETVAPQDFNCQVR